MDGFEPGGVQIGLRKKGDSTKVRLAGQLLIRSSREVELPIAYWLFMRAKLLVSRPLDVVRNQVLNSYAGNPVNSAVFREFSIQSYECNLLVLSP